MKSSVLSMIPFLLLVAVIACKSDMQDAGQQQKTNASGQEAVARGKTSTFNRYYEGEDELVTFFVQAENGEITKPRVRTKGLENEFDQTFTIEGQLIEGHLLDLDGDGFNELYLVYRQTDDAGNLDMIAIRTNSYLDASVVGVQKIREIRKVNSDQIFEINGKLRRTFMDQDGNTINYTYQLVKGSQGWYLLPVKG